MVFHFVGLAEAPTDRVVQTFREMAPGHGLSVSEAGTTIRFTTDSLFRYMNFEPFQFVDDGTLELQPIQMDRTQVSYRVRTLRAWYTLPVWLIAGVYVQAWVALAGMLLTLLVVYFQQRRIFRRVLQGSQLQ